MKKMYAELRSKGVEVVAITKYYGYYKAEQKLTPDQEFAKMKDYMEEWELPWPMVFGGQANFDNYGVGGIPHYVVIDQEGKVASYTVGYNEELHNQLRKSVESLLKPAVAQR